MEIRCAMKQCMTEIVSGFFFSYDRFGSFAGAHFEIFIKKNVYMLYTIVYYT